MVNVETGEGANVGFFKHAARKLAVVTLLLVSRHEMTDSGHSIDKAKENLRRGYGLVIVANHRTKKEPPQIMNEIFLHRVMDSKKIIAPIAYHMDEDWYHWLGKLLGFKVFPIVTKNTIKIKEEDNDRKLNLNDGKTEYSGEPKLELNDGMKEYVYESIKSLKKGEIVILFPQGTRMPHLGQPDNLAIRTLMKRAEKEGLENYAFLFIGFGIKGVDDYSGEKIKGLNLSKKYIVNIGACLTRKELMEKAGGNIGAVDKAAYEELRKVVPDACK